MGRKRTSIAGQMYLFIESVMALPAMLVALAFGTGGAGGGLALQPAWLAFPVSFAMALGVGALIGWLNGTLVVRFEINPFIVTLASYISVPRPHRRPLGAGLGLPTRCAASPSPASSACPCSPGSWSPPTPSSR